MKKHTTKKILMVLGIVLAYVAGMVVGNLFTNGGASEDGFQKVEISNDEYTKLATSDDYEYKYEAGNSSTNVVVYQRKDVKLTVTTEKQLILTEGDAETVMTNNFSQLIIFPDGKEIYFWEMIEKEATEGSEEGMEFEFHAYKITLK